MSKSDDKTPRTAPADLQEFVLAISTAMHGAASRFPNDKRPPIIFGAYSGPIFQGPGFPGGPGIPGIPGGGLPSTGSATPRIPDSLRAARVEMSEEGIARLNKRLAERDDGAEVAIALFADPVPAMADLFDMDEDQIAEVRQNACGNAGLPAMATAVQAIRAAGIPMQLDFRIAEDARSQKARGKLCVTSFTISGSGTIQGGASGVGGGATVGGSVTFGRCKK